MLSSELVDIPEIYLCPITKEIMINPMVTADGHTYEYKAIHEWLSRGNLNSPMTGLRLKHDILTENHLLKIIIQDFRAKLPQIQRDR